MVVQLFSQWKWLMPAEERLAMEMEKNPLYPFCPTDGLYALELTVQYKSLYFAIAMFIASVSTMVTLAIHGMYRQLWFLASVCATFVSMALINNFKDTRHYILNTGSKSLTCAQILSALSPVALLEYTFAHSSPFFKERAIYVKGSYHNIYIRLRKELREGHKKFYLVLNGYRVDCRQISGTSKNVEEMRKLGKRIAENLNLNYFDVTNSSEHHVIKHPRPTKKHRTFLPNMNVSPTQPMNVAAR